jgi:integrase
MGVRVRFDRGAWWIFVHHKGQRTKRRIGADRQAAEEAARELRKKLPLMDLGAAREEGPRHPFSAFAADWFRFEVSLPVDRGESDALSPRSRDIHEGNLRRYLKPFFGEQDVREIGPERIAELRRHLMTPSAAVRGKALGGKSIDDILGTLRRILTHAEARGIVSTNAVATWKRRATTGRRRSAAPYRVHRENVLTSDELARFLAVSEERFPEAYSLVLFLADTGARIGEAIALRLRDIDLGRGTAWIRRSFSDGKYLGPTKTGEEREIELSSRLVDALKADAPEVFGDETLVFPSRDGTLLDPNNFRDRVFRRIVREAFGPHRRFTPHGLRHTFASLHLARGTPIKWIQNRGGWASAKLVLDLYGHFLPSDYHGFADALGSISMGSPKHLTAPQAHPALRGVTPEADARTKKLKNTAMLAGSPGRTRTCDPSVNSRLLYRLSYRGTGS